ncbi:gp591 [Bacillus phage G]|uniref:Gp591 n=1 Tax=Bacillus phage G TaxID=2884420 RepID=G3MAX1_9CAUD|nr:gp591 [Bacillus phage G]AEO93836.1 gp591 [Bacillus phage G]
MDVFKELEDINKNLKKLRDSIYENNVFEKSTKLQQDTFYRMLKVLIDKTITYMDNFNDKNHVIKTSEDIVKMQNELKNSEITFYLNTFQQKLSWYYENDKSGDSFIPASDMMILWPLRAINERMYRYLFNQTHDHKFDNFFNEIDEQV